MERWRQQQQQQHESEEALNSRVGYNKGHSPFCLFFTSSHLLKKPEELKTICIFSSPSLHPSFFMTALSLLSKLWKGDFPSYTLLSWNQSWTSHTYRWSCPSSNDRVIHIDLLHSSQSSSWHTSFSKHLHLFIDIVYHPRSTNLVVYHVVMSLTSDHLWTRRQSFSFVFHCILSQTLSSFHCLPICLDRRQVVKSSLVPLSLYVCCSFLLRFQKDFRHLNIFSILNITHTHKPFSTVRSVSLSVFFNFNIWHTKQQHRTNYDRLDWMNSPWIEDPCSAIRYYYWWDDGDPSSWAASLPFSSFLPL